MATSTEYFVSEDRSASQQAREEMESQGVKWLKIEPGETYVRVLPPHPNMRNKETGAAPFYHHVSLHFGVGPNKRVVVCPRKTTGGALHCPICDYAFALKDAGHEQAGNDLLPSWQAYMNVIVVDPATGEPKRNAANEIQVYVWSAGRGTLDKIFAQIERREKKVKKFITLTDPDEGYVLEIVRKGKTKNDTKYEVFLADEPSSIDEYLEEWAPELVDVTQLNKLQPAEELRGLLAGGEADPFENTAQAATPAAKRLSFSREETVEGEFREVEPEPDDEPTADAAPSDAAERLRKLVDSAKK